MPAVDISSIGPAAAAVIIVFMFLKFLRDEGAKRDKREAQFSKTIQGNTKVTKATYDLLKNLNGELKKAAQKKLET